MQYVAGIAISADQFLRTQVSARIQIVRAIAAMVSTITARSATYSASYSMDFIWKQRSSLSSTTRTRKEESSN